MTTLAGTGVIDFLGDYQVADPTTQILGAFFSQPAGVATSDFFAIGGGGGAGSGSDGVPFSIPEPSTWAMLMLGFAGLTLAGYRKAKSGGSFDRLFTNSQSTHAKTAARRSSF